VGNEEIVIEKERNHCNVEQEKTKGKLAFDFGYRPQTSGLGK
jgi:hypothetical protein